MTRLSRRLAALGLALLIPPAVARTQPPPPTPLPAPKEKATPATPAAPAVTGIAAKVNGQPIPETAVQRGLQRFPPVRHAEVRPELLGHLIDNVLVDQYLVQLQVAVDAKEVDKKVEEMKAEMKKAGKEYDKLLKDLNLTEEELRGHITADLRWDKYVTQQATEKVLRELFEANKVIFDGTSVRARHILLTPAKGDLKAADTAKQQLAQFKATIEKQAADGLAKLPPNSDALAREKARQGLVEDAFSALAKEKSDCPSKAQGGDVGWFGRAGVMVEPFAQAAYALKPGQMSDVVQTPFGFHLILVLDRKPGRDVKFEDLKDEAREVFGERLREKLAVQARQKSQIEIIPPKTQ